MPYTSPTPRSPASSTLTSPCTSRRPSTQMGQSGTAKAELPRSTSYLARNRRNNDLNVSHQLKTEPAKQISRGGDGMLYKGSLRKSPSPITDNHRMLTGVIMSPPESSNNSSDDDSTNQNSDMRGRKLENLKDLEDAIRRTEYSGNLPKESIKDKRKNLAFADSKNENQNSVNGTQLKSEFASSPILHHVHHRSNTDGKIACNSISNDGSGGTVSIRLEDESNSDDDELTFVPKPYMVRKKSGELVRPALRPSVARRRPSSMPGTPTFSKAVHFDSHLEHIRHFLQVDRPLAVSAGSSPVPAYDSDNEFPFNEEYSRKTPYEWEIIVSKFPDDTPERLAQAVRVERVFLSYDNKNLVGSVVVANFAYSKSVMVRFTLDYWKTTSEVVAEFNQDTRQPIPDGFDRFNFNIRLNDLANLESKTMFFCVKYCVNGMEFWDNNKSINFQVDFRKRIKTRNATTRSNNSLPRSNHRSAASRPKSMPVVFDDYAEGFDGTNQFIDFKQAVDDYLGESSSLRLKGSRLNRNLVLDTQIQSTGQPNGNAFGNRYDFGASLSAAMNASNALMRDQSFVSLNASVAQKKQLDEPISPLSDTPHASSYTASIPSEPTQTSGISKPGLSSKSYNDLIDKYCFFGSAKSSPQLKDGTFKSSTAKVNSEMGYIYDSAENSVLNFSTSVDEHFQSSNRSSSTKINSRLVPAIFPGYQNLHEGYPFIEALAVTAIRGQ